VLGSKLAHVGRFAMVKVTVPVVCETDGWKA
jgi:hypothetical protein